MKDLYSVTSGAKMSRNHQALRWWSARQQSCLGSAIEKALRVWEQDWGLAPAADGTVRFELACEGAAAARLNWQPAAMGGACGLWWSAGVAPERSRSDPTAALLEAMFGASSPLNVSFAGAGKSELALGAAKAAWSSLWQRVGQALQFDSMGREPVADSDEATSLKRASQCFKPWSGAMVLHLPWKGQGEGPGRSQELRLLIGGAEVEAFLSQQRLLSPASSARSHAPLTSVWNAVSHLRCTVRAELAPIELPLGAIKALREGDVIGLPHPLNLPLSAITEHGEQLCEVFLGQSGGHRAIELLRTPIQVI